MKAVAFRVVAPTQTRRQQPTRARSTEESRINQDIKGLTPNAAVSSDFLFWFLLSQSACIESMGAGASVKGVTLTDIKRIEVPIPPIPEQRSIVDLLSRAEGIVRLRREAEKKAAELIPALFIDMFGDPGTNPKGWPIRKVANFVTRFEGGKNLQAGSENGSEAASRRL